MAAKTDLHFGQMAALTPSNGCTVHTVQVIQQGRERLRCERTRKAETRLKINVAEQQVEQLGRDRKGKEKVGGRN